MRYDGVAKGRTSNSQIGLPDRDLLACEAHMTLTLATLTEGDSSPSCYCLPSWRSAKPGVLVLGNVSNCGNWRDSTLEGSCECFPRLRVVMGRPRLDVRSRWGCAGTQAGRPTTDCLTWRWCAPCAAQGIWKNYVRISKQDINVADVEVVPSRQWRGTFDVVFTAKPKNYSWCHSNTTIFNNYT